MRTGKLIYTFLVLILYAHTSYSKELSQEQIEQITKQISEIISQHYVLKDRISEITSSFQEKVNSNKYQSISDAKALAKVISEDLIEISNDKHLYLKYHASSADQKDFDWESWEQEERVREKAQNFGFSEIKILKDNVGYLKIVEAMHPQRGMKTAVAAMTFLQNTDALIIDLRGNGGGYGGLLDYILNHFFAGGPTHLSTTYYSEKSAIPTKHYSSDLVYGTLRNNTPLFIIIDEKTGSAAEFFAYTLQAFSKATIVGEKSAGAAHMNTFYPLHSNLRLSVSTAAPINSITNTNWENSGVIPDYIVSENQIAEARRFAVEAIGKNGN